MADKEVKGQAFKRAEKEAYTKDLEKITIVAGLLVLGGAFVMFSGYILGVAVGIIGLVVFLVAVVIKTKRVNRRAGELIDYHKIHGYFPEQ